MARGKKIYEGKAKTLYEGPEPGTIIQYFKDDATAFNAVKKDTLDGKGALNNLLCEHFMLGLNTIGLPTHFIRRLNVREQLVHKVEIVPLEIIVRNVAAGSFSKMFNIEERVNVTLKPGVLDPQGAAVRHSLGALGFDGVNKVRQGKVIELDLNENDPIKAKSQVEKMCDKLLANTVIENYSVEVL